jgi:hypothetical protein
MCSLLSLYKKGCSFYIPTTNHPHLRRPPIHYSSTHNQNRKDIPVTTPTPSPRFIDRIHWLGSEIFLGTLIALLGIFTGVASYQGSMSDSDQNKYQNEGMQTLTDANAEYLTANQFIVYDYSMYDGWYLDETGLKADYFQSSFSESLQTSIAADPENPFSDAYYTDMYKTAEEMFTEADAKFSIAEEFNTRGDKLQLVMLISAVGLAFAAWASLLNEKSRMRLVFSTLALIATIFGLIAYLGVPTVAI